MAKDHVCRDPNSKPSRLREETGFTLIEILIATGISLLLIALLAGVFQSQRETFVLQNQLNKMEANGRAAVDYVSRLFINSGYNVVRGTRFLAASDHYLTAVYDQNNDNAIQSNEVVTLAAANIPGSADETFTISPYWDVDGDGKVDSTEKRDYDISLTLSGPPYNLYKILPGAVDNNTYTRNRIAQYLDNLVIRYFDKNGNPLPAGVTVDGNGNPVPPFTLAQSELNEIRRIEVEVVARTKNPDPRDGFTKSGNYLAGSIATLGGSGTYADQYHRETFASNLSPRNLVMAPWGKLELTAIPNPVTCPGNQTTITATLVDAQGEPAPPGTTINFNTTGTGVVGTASAGSNAFGEASTTLTYDWSAPSTTLTFSSDALIDVNGKDNPVFNAIPVSFESGNGIFTDDFDDGDSIGWTTPGGVPWSVNAGEYKTGVTGTGISLNGCTAWQNYEMQMDIKRNGPLGTGQFAGMILRYLDATQYYMVRIICTSCTGSPAAHVYNLQIAAFNGAEMVLSSLPVTFNDNTSYKIKAGFNGSTLNAKIWESSDPEPGAWDLSVTDTTFSRGQIGLITTRELALFDNIAVTPAS